jgi:hypothetical protein
MIVLRLMLYVGGHGGSRCAPRSRTARPPAEKTIAEKTSWPRSGASGCAIVA